MKRLLGLLTLSVTALVSAQPALAQEPIDPMTVCFAPGTDAAYMQWFRSTLHPQPEFVSGSRWTIGGSQGDPVSLRWSFVPDGLTITSAGAGDPSGASELFSRMDALFAGQGGRATWVARVQSCVDRWEALTGIDFTRVTAAGVDWDDGASWGSPGGTTRGEIRISMRNIDGGSNTLAYAFFPNNGDIVMDRSENWADATNFNRFLRNVLTHELGHAVGLEHVCSSNSSQLMDPIADTSFDGPRQDDIRACQRLYGDINETDNTSGSAVTVPLTVGVTTSLGVPPLPLTGTNDPNASTLSIDANGEVDFFRFTTASSSLLDVSVTPVGSTYFDNPEPLSGPCPVGGTSTNALTQANLQITVFSTNGTTVLATANVNGAGGSETLTDVFLPAAGTYFVRVSEADAPTQPQLYRMTLRYDFSVCPDGDGDGVDDCSDNCPLFPNAGQADLDGDGVGNACDNCPANPNTAQNDNDSDAIGNVCDNCPNNSNPTQSDLDGDGLGDACDGCPNDPAKTAPGLCGCGVADTDSDGDDTPNCLDGCPNDPTKIAPGVCGCGVPEGDTDGDGVANCIDNCPTFPNATQADVDGDGVGNACDNCRFDVNPNQADSDVDAIGDVCDNCPNVSNTTQTDGDGDGAGDACDGCPSDPAKSAPGQCGCGVADTDTDSDGVANCLDNCDTIANPSQADCDLDTVGDACELFAGTQWDSNNNGVPDQCESCPGVIVYCTAGTSSAGCVPVISATGNPSISAASGFVVNVTSVEGQRAGLLFYSVSGPRGIVWAPGSTSFLCMKSPTQRTTSQVSGGTAGQCNGSFSIDMLDFWVNKPAALGQPIGGNRVINIQAWYRDPSAPATTNLSGGLQFKTCP